MIRQLKEKRNIKDGRVYANALLLALTVLFAGASISLPKKEVVLPILSLICGLAGIVFTVLWFSLETDRKINGRPMYLFLATSCFAWQSAWLFVALLVSQFSN